MTESMEAVGRRLSWMRRNWRWTILLAVLFACGALIWYWALDRDPPRINVAGVALNSDRHARSPYAENPDELVVFPRGSNFEGRWSLTIARGCEGVAARWVTSVADPTWFLVLPSQVLIKDQNIDNRTQLPVRRWLEVASFVVPNHAPLGEAAYHVQVSFYCNPLHWLVPIRVSYPVIRFVIGERVVSLRRPDEGAGRRTPPMVVTSPPQDGDVRPTGAE